MPVVSENQSPFYPPYKPPPTCPLFWKLARPFTMCIYLEHYSLHMSIGRTLTFYSLPFKTKFNALNTNVKSN